MAKAAIQVLPGRFLARNTEQGNPGEGYVRIALVADVKSCVKAAETMVALIPPIKRPSEISDGL